MESYWGAGKENAYMAGVLARLKKDLEEGDAIDGPYRCSYLSFQDICHIMARMDERDGTESHLLLCTLVTRSADESGQRAGEKAAGKDERAMELLQRLLKEELRAGDAYTRYSQDQFLVLLAGTDGETGQGIVRRLKAHSALYGQDRQAAVRFVLDEGWGPDTARSGTEGPDIDRSRPGQPSVFMGLCAGAGGETVSGQVQA